MIPKSKNEIEFIQSQESGVSLIEDIWQTPSTYLSSFVRNFPQVRLIGDSYSGVFTNYCGVRGYS